MCRNSKNRRVLVALASFFLIQLGVVLPAGCRGGVLGGSALMADERIADQVGRSLAVVDIVIDLREESAAPHAEEWYPITERVVDLHDKAGSLGMSRMRVLTSGSDARTEFYTEALPQLEDLARQREELLHDALAIAYSQD